MENASFKIKQVNFPPNKNNPNEIVMMGNIGKTKLIQTVLHQIENKNNIFSLSHVGRKKQIFTLFLLYNGMTGIFSKHFLNVEISSVVLTSIVYHKATDGFFYFRHLCYKMINYAKQLKRPHRRKAEITNCPSLVQ